MVEKSHDKPEPKVSGYVDARYKKNELHKVELTVEHFVDDWYETDFVFRVEGGVARMVSIEAPGSNYWIDQNEPARNHAKLTVEALPQISIVESSDF